MFNLDERQKLQPAQKNGIVLPITQVQVVCGYFVFLTASVFQSLEEEITLQKNTQVLLQNSGLVSPQRAVPD